MARKKRKSSKGKEKSDSDIDEAQSVATDTVSGDDDLESVVGDDFDDDLVATDLIDPESEPSSRLETKRRLDAYLERKWFEENGWDDDDDLFKDEFFEDTGAT